MKNNPARLSGFYRHGKVYFRAAWIKSRRAFRIYWLSPSEAPEIRSRKLRAEIPAGSRRLKTRPSKQTLTASWLIK